MIALVVGAWNFLERSRERFLNLHRWLGRLYIVSVLPQVLLDSRFSFTAKATHGPNRIRNARRALGRDRRASVPSHPRLRQSNRIAAG
jgi:hypothetical protein